VNPSTLTPSEVRPSRARPSGLILMKSLRNKLENCRERFTPIGPVVSSVSYPVFMGYLFLFHFYVYQAIAFK
jgi:hypothetical protein